MLVGEIDKAMLRELVNKAEKLIKRKLRTLVLTLDEFDGYKESLESDKAIWLWRDGNEMKKPD